MRYLALLMVGWLSLPVYALTQVDIYRAEVVIDAEQKDGEALARQRGMQEVIVRATGSQSSLSNPVIEKALDASSRYVSQLSYGQLDGQSSLKMLFNRDQLRSLLTQAQLPFWSPNRANILVWLVEEQGYERAIIWEHSASTNVSALRAAAEARGLPLTMPVGDFDDVTGVNVADLWGGFIEPMSQASQRYPVDAVLVLRVQGDHIRWALYDQVPQAILESQSSPLAGSATGANAVSAIVDGIADYYAQKSAVVVSSESSESIDVKVLNVNSASDFFTLEKSLTKLSSVAATEIKRVQGHEVTLTIHLLASKQAFEQEARAISQLILFQDPLVNIGEVISVEAANSPTSVLQTAEGAEVEGSIETPVKKVVQEPLEALPAQPISLEPGKERDELIYQWSGVVRS